MVMLENLWSKWWIFEVYLNVIEWGNGVFGVEVVVCYYFKISVVQLGLEQVVWLVGMVLNFCFYDKNCLVFGLGCKVVIIFGCMLSVEVF